MIGKWMFISVVGMVMTTMAAKEGIPYFIIALIGGLLIYMGGCNWYRDDEGQQNNGLKVIK